MNINLNLATRPYIELRSVYARLRILAIALAVIALPLFLVMHLEEAKAAATRAHSDPRRAERSHDPRDRLSQPDVSPQGLFLDSHDGGS
jgi:type IV pilus assembly protein PilN